MAAAAPAKALALSSSAGVVILAQKLEMPVLAYSYAVEALSEIW